MIKYFLNSNFLLILIDILGVWVAIWVLFDNRRSKINKNFFLMVISILSWITFYHFASSVNEYNLSITIMLFRIAGGSVFLFFIAYYFFIIRFLDKKGIYEIFGKLILIYGFAFCLITIFTNFIIPFLRIEEWGNSPLFSIWGWFTFYGYVIILTILINILLIIDYFKSSKRKKIKIQYFLFGLFLFAILNFTFNVILQVFFKNYKFYQFGNYSTLFLLVFTAYAIVKQNLFDIKTVLTTFFVGATAILIGVDTFSFTQNIPILILKSIILIIFLIFGYLLIKNVKQEMERRSTLEKLTKELEKKTTDLQSKTQDLKSLLEISHIAASSLKIREVTQEILNSIPEKLKHLGYIGGILTLHSKKDNMLQAYAITRTVLIEKALSILGQPFERYSISLNNNNTLLLKTLITEKVYISHRIEDFISPPVPKKVAQMTQKIVGMRLGVSIPIIIRGEIAGVIMFALSRRVNQIDQRDKEIMITFSNHLGLTIENSRLYGEATDKGKKLERLNKDLKEALESKSNFLSIASHQLRTPVSIAKGMLSMLFEGDVPKDQEHKLIERSFVNLQRLSNIIHDLLSAGAIEGKGFKLNKKLVKIDNIIAKVLEERVVEAKNKNLELIYNHLNPPMPLIKVDEHKIAEVIANLIDNSIQYTQKGTIKIETKISNNRFVFSIQDTGIGIKKDDFPKLFKKISRLPDAIKIRPDGTGLGLYLVRRIVKAHGGEINVKSSGVNGRGSTFTFWLPIK